MQISFQLLQILQVQSKFEAIGLSFVKYSIDDKYRGYKHSGLFLCLFFYRCLESWCCTPVEIIYIWPVCLYILHLIKCFFVFPVLSYFFLLFLCSCVCIRENCVYSADLDLFWLDHSLTISILPVSKYEMFRFSCSLFLSITYINFIFYRIETLQS